MAEAPTRRWIVTLAGIVAIAPMSIDMYLPSLPALQQHFGADSAATLLTLSAYFLGLAFGQIFYGPVADRFGRRGPLLFGLMLYTLASLGCVFAPTIEALTALRLLQALGGAAGAVITRAMVRDRFPPQEMARILSLLILVMGIAPILAPLAGGQILLWVGWQAIFVVLVIYGLTCLAAVALVLPETIAQKNTQLTLASATSIYVRMLGHRRFMGYALAGGIAQAGMFAYISGSPFVFIEVFGVAPSHFGWLFGANAFGLILASQLNARLLKRHRSEVILKRALSANAICGLVLLAVALAGGGLPFLLPPMFLFMSSLGFSFPNSTAGAMSPFGDRAGMASALLGSLQFSLAATASAVVGHLHNGTALPMVAVMAGCACSAWLILRFVAGRPAVLPTQK